MLEAVVLATKNLLDAITMGACPSRSVVCPFPEPVYGELSREFFRTDVSWSGTWTGFAPG